MREGYVFLDEKCLLLAGTMLREVRRFDALRAGLGELQHKALQALRRAAARHGLHGLQCYPATDAALYTVRTARRSLLGVTLLEAHLERAPGRPEPAVNPSPEAEGCRAAFGALLPMLVEMAAIAGNLERLYREYRRTVRRVRALQDVLLPEIDVTLKNLETRLEELERDEALWVRRPLTGAVD
jgi:V/A-type H+-transporting ATPase subunit D